MKCCADEAGAGRPHVDQPEAADLHHVAAVPQWMLRTSGAAVLHLMKRRNSL